MKKIFKSIACIIIAVVTLFSLSITSLAAVRKETVNCPKGSPTTTYTVNFSSNSNKKITVTNTGKYTLVFTGYGWYQTISPGEEKTVAISWYKGKKIKAKVQVLGSTGSQPSAKYTIKTTSGTIK